MAVRSPALASGGPGRFALPALLVRGKEAGRERKHPFRRSTGGDDRAPRLNGEVKRRTNVIGIFPNEEAAIRLVGATLL